MKTGRIEATQARSTKATALAPRTGFTLIELLVVIAIIGILAALLLPVLSRAKSRGLSIACLNNLKQLSACWHLYALDYTDFVPPNNSVALLSTWDPLVSGASWCTNNARYDADPAGITQGLLYTYNKSLGIYRCPADRSTLENPDGTPLPTPRLRSYNMSQSVNGFPEFDRQMMMFIPSYKKYTRIQDPPPAALIAFLDVHEDAIVDALFGIPTRQWWGIPHEWWDVPADRHTQGCNLSFADGHAERWKWRAPKKVVQRYVPQEVTAAEKPDYDRISGGIRQTFAPWELGL